MGEVTWHSAPTGTHPHTYIFDAFGDHPPSSPNSTRSLSLSLLILWKGMNNDTIRPSPLIGEGEGDPYPLA
ncbi:hypothetical protein HanIR_Chr12g0612871 [Helianthus annuus]|nr:hypothetical protein HanIR_Chr12g0612871 [Helianthus annuus]